MAIPIPKYLRNIAILKKERKSWIHFDVQCSCGCDVFSVYQNYLNKEEKLLEKPYFDALYEAYSAPASMRTRDADGTLHYWKLYEPGKGLKGKHEEVFIPDRPFFSGIVVIKIRCIDCGKEYVLFDSRIHGYDGMAEKNTQEVLEYEPHFKLKCKDAVKLEIKIENDESFDEFQENTEFGFTEDQYSDAFSWITIYRINSNGNKTKIFDWETS